MACPITVTSSYTPGTVGYSYYANGNVQTRTAPANNAPANSTATVTTTYSYDALNRLTVKTYSDTTPPAHFNYDESTVTVGSNAHSGPWTITNGIGRMTSWYVGASEPGLAMKSFSYDAMGRPIGSWQCWGSSECTSAYGTRENQRSYDLAGNVTSIDNSADAGFQYTYDNAGQITSVNYSYAYPSPGTVSLVVNATYTPFGQPSGSNGTETWTYDKRLRVTSYTSVIPSKPINYGYSLIYQPNGNISTATETSQGNSWTWNYTYDNLDRLYTAVNAELAEGCQETYDTFGNRSSQQPYGASNYACSPSTLGFTGNGTGNNTNNRVDGFCYDAAGNLLDDGSCPANVHKFTYDAEGRIATAMYGAVTNIYGADGLRTTKQTSGNSYNLVYDFDGTPLTHYSGNTPAGQSQEIWVNGRHYGYFGTPLLGSTGAPYLVGISNDWVGTKREVHDRSGNSIATFCSLPFGDGVQTCIGSGSAIDDPTFYTGKERDSESQLDYFGARYYASSMGRFISPDPWLGSMDVTNPQSLNRYSYALNNPLKYTDPTGLDCVYFNDAGNGVESVDHNSNSGECGQNGGDWVNGTTSASQIQYNANNDTFNIRSSDTWQNYNTTASAPGSQTNGTSCYGNCDTPTGYSSSLRLTDWLGYQGRYVGWLVSVKLNQANTAANNVINSKAAMNFACYADPGNVMAIQDLQRNHRADPSDPADPLVGGGASAIYMNNNQATRNGGQNNILGNQQPAAAAMGGAGLIGNQIVQGGICAGQQ